jgi:hypothetical protein
MTGTVPRCERGPDGIPDADLQGHPDGDPDDDPDHDPEGDPTATRRRYYVGD